MALDRHQQRQPKMSGMSSLWWPGLGSSQEPSAAGPGLALGASITKVQTLCSPKMSGMSSLWWQGLGSSQEPETWGKSQ